MGFALHFYWHGLGAEDENAPTLLMLHGFLGSGRDWAAVAEKLRPPWRCLCPDLPGHGKNGRVEHQACCFIDTADHLMDDLMTLGVSKTALLGYSMGGRLALYLAATHPEHFHCLLLESASPGLQGEEERAHRQRHDQALAREIAAYAPGSPAFRDFLQHWYTQPIFHTLAQAPAALELLIERRMANDPQGLAASLHGMGTGAQSSLWEALPTVTLPTLLLAGAEDHKFRLLGEKMAAAMPQAALEVLEGCSHNLHFEQPEAYATVISAFLHTQNTQE